MPSPCPVCKRPMTALFTSFVCDWCDGLKRPVVVDRGFVLWPGAASGAAAAGRELNVFRSREMAAYYQRVTGAEGKIREILTETPIRWVSGVAHLPNVQVAETMFTVFPDHRFEPGEHRAFLARKPRRRAA